MRYLFPIYEKRGKTAFLTRLTVPDRQKQVKIFIIFSYNYVNFLKKGFYYL